MHRVVVCPRMINSSLVAVQVLPLLEFMRGGSYIQNLISFSYLVPGMVHSVMRFGQVGTTSDKLRSRDCNCDGVIYCRH